MSDELLDICDADDHVVGQATRRDIHAQNLLHRAVHIWVVRSDGRLLVHRRTATKDQYPSCYTSSASGHVDPGETYLAAATRELAEELALDAGNLVQVVKLAAGPETACEHTMLYQLTTDTEPIPNPDEIESLHWWTPAELDRELAAAPGQFTPPFRALWNWVREHPWAIDSLR